MTELAERLERLHKMVDSAMTPFTLMLGRRKYSPSVLAGVCSDLQKATTAMFEFIEEQGKVK